MDQENKSSVWKWVWGIIVILVVVLLVSATGKKSTENGPIKIGFIGPLTGDVSNLGEMSKVAVELAVEEINSSGGINGRKVEVVYEDGKCLSGTASSAALKMINIDKVTAIIGGLCSGETSSFIKPASDAKIPVISYCSSAPSLSSSGQYFFRTYPSDSFQGKLAAEYAFNNLKVKNIAVLYHISDWGTGIKDVFVKRFTELGGKVVIEEGTSQDVRDYKTQLTKIKSINPDYIYMPMYTEGAIIAVQQMQDIGIKTKILGADAWSDLKFIKDVNKNADIIYVGSTNSPTKEFESKIIAKTGSDEVPICAPQAYDATMVLFDVMKKGNLDGKSLTEALHSVKYQGVTGEVEFDQNGDIKSVGYVVKKIQNGQTVDIDK